MKHTNSPSSPYHTLKKSDVKKPSGIPLPKMHKQQEVTASANYIDIGGQRIYTSPPDNGVQVKNYWNSSMPHLFCIKVIIKACFKIHFMVGITISFYCYFYIDFLLYEILLALLRIQ